MLYGILLGIEVIIAILLIVLILLHRGKGAEVGAVFSGGGSTSVFGARGSASFLTKVVATLSALFLVNSLALTYIANRDFGDSVIDDSAIGAPPLTDEMDGAPPMPDETGREPPDEDAGDAVTDSPVAPGAPDAPPDDLPSGFPTDVPAAGDPGDVPLMPEESGR